MDHINEFYQDQEKTFQHHLNIPENNRIIFSGIYGIGKSYFINKFFKDNSRYEVIHLFPINYSVASTEDIFDYIKFDLFFELIKKYKIEFDALNLKFSQKLYLYLSHNWDKFAGQTIQAISDVGKDTDTSLKLFDSIVTFLAKAKKSINEHYEKQKAKYDNNDLIEKFIDSIVEKPGSLFDQGAITSIIEQALKQVTGNEGTQEKKETILVIDDLDRIDPEHIFRILNIFAAHFDLSNPLKLNNKFGFDKVILVCDIENIRNFFHHKYGTESDFIGYIDKFYSHEVFQFDPSVSIVSSIMTLFRHMNISDAETNQKIWKNDDQFIHFFVKALIKQKILNLRSLVKFCNEHHQLNPKIITLKNGEHLTAFKYEILWGFIFLKQIFGNQNSFRTAMLKLNLNNIISGNDSIETIFRELLLLATSDQHNFSKITQAPLHFQLPGIEQRMSYTTKGDDKLRIFSISKINPEDLFTEIEYRKNIQALFEYTIGHLIKSNFL